MNKHLYKQTLLFLIIAVSLSGCAFDIKTKGGSDGGLFISNDHGDTWLQRSSYSSAYCQDSTTNQSFKELDVTAMAQDEQDTKAIYLGTEIKGVLFSYDQGLSWSSALAEIGQVNDIKVSPKYSCTVYAAISNRVYKTMDCSRHWTYKLIETQFRPNDLITSLAIDYNLPEIVYAGSSGGGLFISRDAGVSWTPVNFFKDIIMSVLVNRSNSNVIYVGLKNSGIFRSADGGKTWNQLLDEQVIQKYPEVTKYRVLIVDPTVADGLIYASQYGILRSANGGTTWRALKLLTPPGSTVIHSLAVSPKNGDDLYYGIATALYRTRDSGKTWETRNLPSSRVARFLLADPQDEGLIYLGPNSMRRTNFIINTDKN